MYSRRLVVQLIAVGLLLLMTSPLSAEDASVGGFSNYYKLEGTFDWAKNCRVIADLPAAGTQLPVPVRLKFVFEHDQERLNVFQYYSGQTRFDLGFFTSATPFAYQQSGKYPSVSNEVATVTFDAFDLRVPAGNSGQLNFEIYGDCEACSTNEASPPDRDHTTWRVFGAIEVVTDNVGKVVTCRLINIGSEEPAKELPSQDPRYYPKRMAPRQSFFTRTGNLPRLSSGCCRQPECKPCWGIRECRRFRRK